MKSILKKISDIFFDLAKVIFSTFVIGYFLKIDLAAHTVAIASFGCAILVLAIASYLLYKSEEK